MGCASAKQLWDVTRRIVMALRELVEAPQVLAALTADLVIPILTTRLTTAFTATMARCSWLISIAALIVVLAAPLSLHRLPQQDLSPLSPSPRPENRGAASGDGGCDSLPALSPPEVSTASLFACGGISWLLLLLLLLPPPGLPAMVTVLALA